MIGVEWAQATMQLLPFVPPLSSKLTGTPFPSVEMAVEVNKTKKESISVEFGRVGETRRRVVWKIWWDDLLENSFTFPQPIYTENEGTQAHSVM